MPIAVASFVFVVWLCVFVAWQLRRSNKRRTKMDDFLEAEKAANEVRKQEIDPALLYTPDLTLLPVAGSTGALYQKIVQYAAQPMIRFPKKMSNLELKQQYGRAQIEVIAFYEENFQRYLSALIKWAEALADSGQKADAIRILEHTVELGSEYRKSYLLLADWYADTENAAEKSEALLSAAQACEFADEAVKQSIIKHLNAM